MTQDPESPSNRRSFAAEWHSIETPSDRLTLGELRRTLGGNLEDIETLVHNLILAEFELGVAACVEAKNALESHVTDRLAKWDIKDLAALYVEAGLASGSHEAEQLAKRYYAAVRKRSDNPQLP
jgi:hypothetical protein